MPTLRKLSVIPIWPSSRPDGEAHYWYRAVVGDCRRICDDASWPAEVPFCDDDEGPPASRSCPECLSLYTTDIMLGVGRLKAVDDPLEL